MRNDTDDLISRQPEHTEKRTETRACDCISRQAVINTVRTIILGFFSDKDGAMTDTEKTLLSVNKSICDGVRELPSTQQDCTDCPEYDTERHYCQKYCDVIRKTLEEAKQERTGHWIPMTYRYVPGAEDFPYLIKKWTEATESDDINGINGLKCSECGEIYDFTEARNWCSECGARMEGEGC